MNNKHTSFGKIEWSEDQEESNNSDNSKRTPFVKFQLGDNKLRILTTPYKRSIHKVKVASDKTQGTSLNCTDSKDCPACLLGIKLESKYLFLAFNHRTGLVEILDAGWQIFKGIKKLVNDEEDWGDPSKYDININKSNDTYGLYTVQGVPPKALKPADLAKAVLANPDDLTFWITPLTADKLQERMDKILGGEDPYVAPKKTDKPTNGAVSKGKLAIPDADDEDFTNI